MPSINSFKTALIGGGARSSLFFVQLSFPNGTLGSSTSTIKGNFLTASTSLPGSKTSVVKVPFQGREIKLAGSREFEDWKITVYNDNDFQIRNSFESWMQNIQQAATTAGLTSGFAYQVDMQVFQLDRTGIPIKQYNFYDCWPTDIGEIELNQEAETEIEKFDVTFSYNYFDTPEIMSQPAITQFALNFITNIL